MSNCQRCGDILPPNAVMCPRCGAPVTDPRWTQSPQGPAGGFAPGARDQGGWPGSPAAQGPQFSAGDLISDASLPEWMREGLDGGQGAAWTPPAQQPRPQQGSLQGSVGAGWGATPGGWQGVPQPAPLESQQTIRQPAIASQGAQAYSAFVAPQPPPLPQQYDPRYAAPPAPQAYPQNPGYPGNPYSGQSASQGFAPYPQQYQPLPPQPQPGMPPPQGFGPPSAFPPLEQAGAYGPPPQPGGMAARGFVDQGALPPWLAGAAPNAASQGASLGMQARSLVDEQALPEWLRNQPEQQARPQVSGWQAGPVAGERPPARSEFPGFQNAPATSPYAGGTYAPQPQNFPPNGGSGWQGAPYGTQAPQHSEDVALPGWLQAQAGGAAPADPRQFAAPAAAPHYDWGSAAAEQFAPPQPESQNQHVDMEPTMRTPNVPTWGAEPDGGFLGVGGDQEWRTPNDWDDEQPVENSDQWSASAEQEPSHRAPLAQNELPPWLRGRPDLSGGQPNRGEWENERQPYAQDEGDWESREQGAVSWDDQGGAWDDQRAHGAEQYAERRDEGRRDDDWGGYDERRGPDRRESWDDQSGGRDHYSQRDPRWDGSQGQWESADGYAGGENPYASAGRRPAPRDPYDAYDGYGEGDPDGYYEDDEPRRGRKGWRGFFRRD